MASVSPQYKIMDSRYRILILTPGIPELKHELSPISSFLHALTGVAPAPEQSSFVGYTQHQPLKLVTKYYSSNVGLWCDVVPTSMVSLAKVQPEGSSGSETEHGAATDEVELTLTEWTEQMLSNDAEEVRRAIGAIVLLLPIAGGKDALLRPSIEEIIRAVDQLKDSIEEGELREIATVILLRAPGKHVDVIENAVQQMESTLIENIGVFGWDVAGWDEAVPEARMSIQDGTRNEHGEKRGLARVKEVLEAVDWSTSDMTEGETDIDFPNERYRAGRFSTESMGEDAINLQARGLEQEFMGLKLAMVGLEDEDEMSRKTQEWPNDEADDIAVEKLQSLMERAMAIREAAAEMSPADRDTFARREVASMMRDIG